MNKDLIKKFEGQCWDLSKIDPYFDYMKFATLVWNEAYRQGIHDGWSDSMQDPYLDESDCPCGEDGGTSCGATNCLMTK